MPMPSGLDEVLTVGTPNDAHCLERLRDRTLWLFAHPRVQRVFLTLSILVCVLVVLNGLLIVYAILGLFLNVPNGWNVYAENCVHLAQHWNQTLTPLYIPKPPGAKWGWSRTAHTSYCTANQFWFNFSVKLFVVLFSYINFLPIPWRLSILHHLTCSRRSCEAGRDFYGRPHKIAASR